MVRTGFGMYYGPASSRIASSRLRTPSLAAASRISDIPNNGLAYPVPPAVLRNLLSIRGYTHDYPAEYNIQYGASVSRELPGAINLTVGYTGSQGRDMFLRGVGNVLDPVTRVRPVPSYGQIDFKTGGCVDAISMAGLYDIAGCGRATYDALQVSTSGASAAGSREACSISSRVTVAPPRGPTRR